VLCVLIVFGLGSFSKSRSQPARDDRAIRVQRTGAIDRTGYASKPYCE